MKIALCLSGQARSFNKGYQYVQKNLLLYYDVDIFIHVWKSANIDVTDLIDLYRPAKFIIEEPLFENRTDLNAKYTNTPNPKRHPPINTIAALYSVYKSMLLKCESEQSGQPYDCVIRSRFDYALNRKPPVEFIEPDKIYIPNCRVVPARDTGNDQFAFGTSAVMNAYMSTYLYIDDYYDLGFELMGESLMSANLHKHGLIGERLEYIDMNNPFSPGPYNGSSHSLIRDDYQLWEAAAKK